MPPNCTRKYIDWRYLCVDLEDWSFAVLFHRPSDLLDGNIDEQAILCVGLPL